MKKKLFIIAAVIFSSVAFTACEKEIIMPTETTEEGDGNGEGNEDPGQWD